MINSKNKKQQSLFYSVTEFIFLLLIVFLIRTFGFGLYQVPTGSMETTMLVGERFFADKFTYNFIRSPIHGDIIAFNDPEFEYSQNYLMNLFQQYVWGPSNWTKRVIGIPGDTIVGAVENGSPVIYRNGEKLNEPYLNKYPLIHVWRQDFEDLRSQVEADLQGLYRGRMVDQQAVERYIYQRLAGETTWQSYDPDYSLEMQPFYRMKESRVIRDEEGNLELLAPATPLPMRNGPALKNGKNHWDGTDVFHIALGADEYWCMGDNRLGSKDCRFLGPIKGKLIHGRIIFLIWSHNSDESWWIVDLIKHPIDFWSRMRWGRFFQWVR